MEFKDALRRRRERLNMTPEELARRLSWLGAPTTSADVQLWERGRNMPPLENAEFRAILANVLQVPVDSLSGAVRIAARQRDLSDDAIQAAELVDALPQPLRGLALDMLQTLARHAEANIAPSKRDFWAEA
jgi:transcriptional regulator with XRE-family HTH domain